MRDMLLDRGMMGDGAIDFRCFASIMSRAGYVGPVEIEIFSAKDWWTREPDDVLAHCIRRFEALVED